MLKALFVRSIRRSRNDAWVRHVSLSQYFNLLFHSSLKMEFITYHIDEKQDPGAEIPLSKFLAQTFPGTERQISILTETFSLPVSAGRERFNY